MSKARHRRPRPVWDFITGLGVLWSLKWYGRRPRVPQGLPPTQIQHVGLVMEDFLAAASTNYPPVEPCPWGLSVGACTIFHPLDHVNRYAEAS